MNMKKKKILIYTASRSEYGILKSILYELKKKNNIILKILVSGTHLKKKFGSTINEIKLDKFNTIKKINILNDQSNENNISIALSKGIKKINNYFREFKPDVVLILGDRFELYSIGLPSLINNIPIAHIHGGESTYGLIDDYVRHSITKISTFHFTSNEIYRKRVIQMGENPKHVITSGSPSVDMIKKMKFISKKNLEKVLKIKFLNKIFVVTQNPISTNKKTTVQEINNLLNALKHFTNCTIIFTLPTFDNHSDIISRKIKFFCRNYKNTYFYKSLGHTNYLSLIKISNLVLGNSSSGVIEAPYLKTPTINIGNRQSGREMSPSVFTVTSKSIEITNKVNQILKISNKKKLFKKNLYGNGQASRVISNFLSRINLSKIKPGKKFFDINFKI